MTTKTIAGKLIIEITDETEQGGLILSHSMNKSGVVLIAGNDRGAEIMEPQPGDTVIINAGAGIPITINGKSCKRIDLQEVLTFDTI